MTEQEIREDFAAKVIRRLTGMVDGCRCTNQACRGSEHLPPCPAYYWQRAEFIVNDVLQDEGKE